MVAWKIIKKGNKLETNINWVEPAVMLIEFSDLAMDLLIIVITGDPHKGWI